MRYINKNSLWINSYDWKVLAPDHPIDHDLFTSICDAISKINGCELLIFDLTYWVLNRGGMCTLSRLLSTNTSIRDLYVNFDTSPSNFKHGEMTDVLEAIANNRKSAIKEIHIEYRDYEDDIFAYRFDCEKFADAFTKLIERGIYVRCELPIPKMITDAMIRRLIIYQHTKRLSLPNFEKSPIYEDVLGELKKKEEEDKTSEMTIKEFEDIFDPPHPTVKSFETHNIVSNEGTRKIVRAMMTNCHSDQQPFGFFDDIAQHLFCRDRFEEITQILVVDPQIPDHTPVSEQTPLTRFYQHPLMDRAYIFSNLMCMIGE